MPLLTRTVAQTRRCVMSKAVSALAAVTLVAITLPAVADLQIKQESKIRADGFLSIMAADIKSTTSMSDNRSVTKSQYKSKNALMRMFVPDNDQVSIVRLDKGVAWEVSAKEKSYTEIDLAALGDRFEAINQKITAAQGGSSGDSDVATDDACTLSEPRVTVDETGKSKKIAGLKARQTVVTVEQTCELPERDQVCEIYQTWDSWLAEDFPNGGEMKAFYEEFARQTKLVGGNMNQTAATALFAGMFGDAWDAASGEADSLKGYPLQSEIKMEFGGPQCEGLAELRAATAELMDSAASAGVDGAMGEASSQAGEETARQTAEMFGDSPLEKIAGAGVGRAAGEMVSGIFGGLRNMTKGSGEKSNNDSNRDTVFEIRTLVKEINTNALSDDIFELPEGFKRIEAPNGF
ncbi:MAG: hypothetical protein AB8C02_12690 [Halioglobus sp.]